MCKLWHLCNVYRCRLKTTCRRFHRPPLKCAFPLRIHSLRKSIQFETKENMNLSLGGIGGRVSRGIKPFVPDSPLLARQRNARTWYSLFTLSHDTGRLPLVSCNTWGGDANSQIGQAQVIDSQIRKEQLSYYFCRTPNYSYAPNPGVCDSSGVIEFLLLEKT